MSFMRALGTLAVGLAAAKGIEKYKQMGGMSGLQEMMKGASAGQGNMPEQLAQMAERMGVPGGADKMRDLMASFAGGTQAGGTQAGQAGLGGLIAAMQGAASAGGKTFDDMFDSLAKGTPVGQMAEENAKLMIRSMIQAAKADGEIDVVERDKIIEQLEGLDPTERAFVEAELNKPVDVMGLANDVGEQARAQVYATSLMAIRVDNAQETAYLRQLASALQISDEARDRMHAAMGVPPLPKA